MGGPGTTPRLAAAGCAKACRPRRWRFVACTSRRMVHRHTARPRLMELPRHASSKRPPATSGTLSPCHWALSLPVPGRKPVKPSRGKPSRPCSFGSAGRTKRRPCLVSESWHGGGWASMAATFQRKQFPLRYAHSSRDKFFSLPGAPLRCARKRCSQPVPRRSDHNRTRWARTLFNRKEIHHG